MNRSLFCERQIPVLRKLSYLIRDALAPYSIQCELLQLPSKTGMLDITASTLGYRDYQDCLRASKGHPERSGSPVVLTPAVFEHCSAQLALALQLYGFSSDHARWAIAGWFSERRDGALDAEDIALLKDSVGYLRFPFPSVLTEREQRLVVLECMEPVLEHPGKDASLDASLDAVLIGVKPTAFGRWVGARAEAAKRAETGKKLSELDLASWGLPQGLCLMRVLTSRVSIPWQSARPVDKVARLRT